MIDALGAVLGGQVGLHAAEHRAVARQRDLAADADALAGQRRVVLRRAVVDVHDRFGQSPDGDNALYPTTSPAQSGSSRRHFSLFAAVKLTGAVIWTLMLLGTDM